MLQIYIQDLKRGKKEIEISCPVSKLGIENDEYFGDVIVTGILNRIEFRYSFVGQIRCSAKFICDISVKEYEELINIDFKFSAKQKSIHEEMQEFQSDIEDDVIQLTDDAKYIDITEMVGEELLVNLPMKRVAPEFRDKEFGDIFPEYSDNDEHTLNQEEKWSVLKNIKFN